MTPSPRILALVPAYNEAGSILSVIDDLRSHYPAADILVINDGSTDKTLETVLAAGGTGVLDLPLNLGIGGAMQAGFRYASRNGYDIAVQFDADGQHRAEDIPALLAPLLSGRSDVAIGSRFCGRGKGFKSSPMRRLGIRIFELVNSVLIGQRITDNTSGFRAYAGQVIGFLADNYPEDYPEPEAVILLGKNRFRIVEVPVDMRPRLAGASSIQGWRSPYYMIKVLLAILMTFLRTPARRG
jgi:glycosyltransferase involved in cell wall biosynthesis